MRCLVATRATRSVRNNVRHCSSALPLRADALPTLAEPFTVLGIETSCDDTGVAVVRSDGTVLGEALASQAALHEEWGGVVPNLARSAHEEVRR